MPSFNITVPETIESVSRPIIYSILETIKKYLLIHDNVRVIFPGDIGSWTQTTGSLTNKTKESQFTSSRYFQIEVEQNPIESNLGSTAVYYGENPPIILDRSIRLQVTPIYSLTDVIMTLKFITYNKDEAFRWYYNARTQISKMQDIYINTINYHYILPDPLVDLMETIYLLKEKQGGTGISYQQYVERYFTGKATMVTSLDGKSRRLAIAETQTRILGRFEFNPLPEKPELIDEIQAWVCSFQYKFMYDLPNSLNIRYPLMVNNQFLPSPYINYDIDPYHLRDKDLSFPDTLKAMRIFEPYHISQVDNPVLRIPKIDDFVPETVLPHSKGLFYAMLQLDPNNMSYLCNLKDLDYFTLDKELLQFISQGEYEYLTKPYQSVFNISLYAFGNLQLFSFLDPKPDLNIWATTELDITKIYHLVFSVISNFNVLTPEAIYRLYYFVPDTQIPNFTLPTEQNIPGTPLSDIVGNGIYANDAVVATDVQKNNEDFTYLNESISDLPSEITLKGKNFPIDDTVLQTEIDNLLSNDTLAAPNTPVTITDSQGYSEYTPIFSNYQSYEKTLASPYIGIGGSALFQMVLSLLNLTAAEVNYIYRLKTGKDLFNNGTAGTTAGDNNNIVFGTNPQSQITALQTAQAAVAASTNATANYVGFKTVLVSGIAVLSENPGSST